MIVVLDLELVVVLKDFTDWTDLELVFRAPQKDCCVRTKRSR